MESKQANILSWVVSVAVVLLVHQFIVAPMLRLPKFSFKVLFVIVGIALMLLAAFYMFIVRNEKLWKVADIKNRYKRRWWNLAKKRWNDFINMTGLKRDWWVRRRIAPDRLPEIMEENIVILFSLNNYLKRLYIFYSKRGQVVQAEEVVSLMEELYGHHDDIIPLEGELHACRNKGKLEGESGGIEVGWFDANKVICQTINKINEFLREYMSYIASPIPIQDKDYSKYQLGAQALAGELASAVAKMETSYNYLQERAKAFGAHQPLKAWKYLVFDQCNPCGSYEHGYRLINPNTTLLEYDNNGNSREVTANEKLEVNMYGEVLIDKHDEKIPRIVKNPTDIYDFKPPLKIFGWILHDWDGFLSDLRHGEHKYFSKSAIDYISRLGTKPKDTSRLGRLAFFNDENIATSVGWKTKETPAFDRRALVDTGEMFYIGRKNYDERLEDIKAREPLRGKGKRPAVSSIGMTAYLPALVQRDVDDIVEANNYMVRFIGDTAEGITSAKDASKAFGALSKAAGTSSEGGGH